MEDIAKVLSTPRDLCKTCLEWCEDDFYEKAHCSCGYDFNCRNYILGETDNCPRYFEI